MGKIWLLAALLATPAMVSADTGGEPKKENKEKQVCRSEPVLGSRTRVNRICMTGAEWDQLARDSRKGVDDFTRRSGTPTTTKTTPF